MARRECPWLAMMLRWGLPGILLVGLLAGVALISPRFEYGSDMVDRPILPLVALLVIAGAVYLLVAARTAVAHPGRSGKVLLCWVLAVGLAMRVAMLLSAPILEDDFYRYLWDGAVVADGGNPYEHAPGDMRSDVGGGDSGRLKQLANESGVVNERINHPQLRTIYPPVAQGTFAVAHRMKPWSLGAWRLLLLGIDVATVLLLVVLVRELKLPVLCIAVYWWNPLLVKEAFNSGHMDLVAIPFVLAALLLAVRRRPHWAALLLAVATGVKLWPMLLLPVVLRPIFGDARRVVSVALTYSLATGLVLAPMLTAGLDGDAGLIAYGQRWEMNDALFMALAWLVRLPLGAAGLERYGPLVARSLAFLLLAAIVARLLWRPVENGRDLCRRATLIVAAAFLLSPTQFPWYYLALVPLLALHGRLSLLLLTALLPLYYLRFYFSARGNVALFDHWVVWLEYVPVWALILYEMAAARRRRQDPIAVSPCSAISS